MLSYDEEMNRGYWEGFIDYMQKHYPEYEQRKASKERYQIVPPVWLGERIRIAAARSKKPESIFVNVTLISNPKEVAKQWYRQLAAERKSIQTAIVLNNGNWEWEERPQNPESHIILRRHAKYDGARGEQYAWLAAGVDQFHQVFGQRLAAFR